MPNMELIQAVTVGSGGAANIEFTSIPADYTDLYLVGSIRTNRADGSDWIGLSFNSSTSSITQKVVGGDGSGTYSDSGVPSGFPTSGDTATSNTFGTFSFYIPNYAGSNNKSYSIDAVSETNSTTAYAHLQAGLRSNTDALTAVKITPTYGTAFKQYSTAYLYGVSSSAIGAKATGGTITSDDNYYYHTFLESGTFTPTANLTADYLVVAGGGGGGCERGGGGGAGGLRCTVGATGGGGSLETALSLTAQAYTVTVGAGGAGTVYGAATRATAGNNSVFSTITSTGGGGGGSRANSATQPAGGTGGSGGGAASQSENSAPYSGGSGTANQGYAGGNAAASNVGSGGGGGGANAVGTAGSTGGPGNGGNGVTTSISGSSTTYAGGGGGGPHSGSGGTGGTGGGAAGGVSGVNFSVAPSGTANTGGGGGGGWASGTGGTGGSGIVIVRYAK